MLYFVVPRNFSSHPPLGCTGPAFPALEASLSIPCSSFLLVPFLRLLNLSKARSFKYLLLFPEWGFKRWGFRRKVTSSLLVSAKADVSSRSCLFYSFSVLVLLRKVINCSHNLYLLSLLLQVLLLVVIELQNIVNCCIQHVICRGDWGADRSRKALPLALRRVLRACLSYSGNIFCSSASACFREMDIIYELRINNNMV